MPTTRVVIHCIRNTTVAAADPSWAAAVGAGGTWGRAATGCASMIRVVPAGMVVVLLAGGASGVSVVAAGVEAMVVVVAGASVVGVSVVGASVLGAPVVGASVLGASVVCAPKVGSLVITAALVAGASVVGTLAVGVMVAGVLVGMVVGKNWWPRRFWLLVAWWLVQPWLQVSGPMWVREFRQIGCCIQTAGCKTKCLAATVPPSQLNQNIDRGLTLLQRRCSQLGMHKWSCSFGNRSDCIHTHCH
jgi:hypothetical protein